MMHVAACPGRLCRTGLHCLAREPVAQPISKMAFEFDRRKLTLEDVRELIYREILEYHPQVGTAAVHWMVLQCWGGVVLRGGAGWGVGDTSAGYRRSLPYAVSLGWVKSSSAGKIHGRWGWGQASVALCRTSTCDLACDVHTTLGTLHAVGTPPMRTS